MELKIFSGRASKKLSFEVCSYLKRETGHDMAGDCVISNFSDGEVGVEYKENMRGRHVFIIQSTNQPDSNIVELLALIDAAKRSSAAKITAVIPYFGYGRQDRKDKPRVPITAKLMADIIQAAGPTRAIFLDLHKAQIVGFFDIPVDHLYARPVFIRHFKSNYDVKNFVVVGPDPGAIAMARSFAKILNLPVGFLDKRRPEPNKSEIMNVVGDVKGRDVLIVDDLVDTAGTITEGARVLKKAGCEKVICFATHPVFSGDAVGRIKDSPIEKMFTTDSINRKINGGKIEILSVGPLIGEAIWKDHKNESVSSLFQV